MSGDGDLADRKSALAVLDPETGRAAAVIAGHQIDALADQFGDVEAVLDLTDQFLRRFCSRLDMQIARARIGHRGHAALRMAGGFQFEFARGGAIEDPGFQHAAVDDHDPARGDTLGIEHPRALAARAQRIVDDVDAFGENLLAELFAQKLVLRAIAPPLAALARWPI